MAITFDRGQTEVVYSRVVCLFFCLFGCSKSFFLDTLSGEGGLQMEEVLDKYSLLPCFSRCVHFLLAISILLEIAINKFRYLAISP